VIFIDSNPFVIDLVDENAAGLDAFLSGKAKHFAGRLAVPAITPQEWLRPPRSRPRRT
jgi:hypothetical protein